MDETKYYLMVMNGQNETLGIFENYESAVDYIEKRHQSPRFYSIKLMPRKLTYQEYFND